MNSNSPSILVVDDEPMILEVLTSYLEAKGYGVVTAADGGEALERFAAHPVSLVLLDRMLPGISGEAVCAELRKQSRVPIIMLTAKVAEDDLLDGLAMGADDYIAKPFSLREVHARVEAVLRRSGDDLVPLASRQSFGGGDLTVDVQNGRVCKAGKPVRLTPSEWRILSALLKYPGKVFTRDELIALALGEEFPGFDRSVDSHIKNLRQKIEDRPREPVYIRTVHGVGYTFGGEGAQP